ncbi:unnamed protein product [Tenebrio molitor]|jgi:hypothetical protein|nr:unnamed protein product [Tenebrio molitor]
MRVICISASNIVQGDSRIVSDLAPLFLQHKSLSQKNETIVSKQLYFCKKIRYYS